MLHRSSVIVLATSNNNEEKNVNNKVDVDEDKNEALEENKTKNRKSKKKQVQKKDSLRMKVLKKSDLKKDSCKKVGAVLKKDNLKKVGAILKKDNLKKIVHKKDNLKNVVRKKDYLKMKVVHKKDIHKKDERKEDDVHKKDVPEEAIWGNNSVPIGISDVSSDDIEIVANMLHEIEDEESLSKPKKSKTRSIRKRKQEIQIQNEERGKQYEVALQDYHSNPGLSFCACAKKHNVNKSTLMRLVKSGETFKGSGKVLTVLSKEEETKMCNFIIRKLKLGYSLTFHELRYLIQEALIRLCQANPKRTSPWKNHFPDGNFVYNMAERNNLVLRSTMELTKARSMLSLEGLMKWYEDTLMALVNHPDYAECWKDPRRILNQDETGLQVGAGKVKVLAPRGVDHVLYSKGGGSHEHVSLSVTANAAGECVGTRVVYKGNIEFKFISH